MPTVISHAAAGASAGYIFYRDKKDFRFWISVIICSVIPDLDALAFWAGLPYSHTFGHRGFSHSLFFSILLGLLIILLFYREYRVSSGQFWRLWLVFFVVTLTHALLDAMTDGGLGIGLFSPLSNQRYFLPWRPIAVAPIGIKGFFGPWGLRVMKSEFIWLWIPAAVLVAITVLVRRARNGAGTGNSRQ
jgi:inner membrane protein